VILAPGGFDHDGASGDREKDSQGGPTVSGRNRFVLRHHSPRGGSLDAPAPLRGDARTQLVPIVILTSSEEHRDQLRRYESGCNSFVRKPVEFIEFAQTIAQLGVY